MEKKKCSRCNKKLPLDRFYKKHGSDSLRPACKTCHWQRERDKRAAGDPAYLQERAATMRRYVSKNRSYVYTVNQKARRKLRDEVLDAYGGGCTCCGLITKRFLCIDHINDDGFEHRKTVKPSNFYTWLRANEFPPGFQVLCFNCNHAKRFGPCPHKRTVKVKKR